ncbi:hypothetical protein HYW17_01555 [Candidatus Uhrbacteria bacterium]|nr:hypothetical protein [Candidatus Uhrbacteria bacterium]
MSRRVKFFIAIGIVIILGLLFALGLRGRVRKTEDRGQRTDVVQPASIPPAVVIPPPVLNESERAELALELSLETLARSFAERYGSYSNQNQFENVKDLYPFMTDGLRSKAAREIAQAQELSTSSSAAGYLGVTTKAMSVKVEERTAESARTAVQTQRKEVRDAESPRIYYQEIMLVFIKDGEQWKVDGVEWR